MGKSIKDTKKEDNSAVFKVQVGSFREKKNAEELVKKLEKHGYEAVVIKP